MIDALMTTITAFVPKEVLFWLAGFSVVGFLGTLIAIPFVLIRLPATYFDERYPRHWMRDSHPFLRVIAHLLKNAAGVVFIVAGLAMLFLPGQGLLTMLMGLSLLDFPGKRRLEAKIISQPTIFRAVNNLRTKSGRPPLSVVGSP